MNNILRLGITAILLCESASTLCAQQYGIREGYANSTSYTSHRFPEAPRYIPGLVNRTGRRMVAPSFEAFGPRVLGLVRGGAVVGSSIIGSVGSAATFNLQLPATVYAPGAPPRIGPCQYPRCR